jgi:ParB family chromosome partitioning protein
MSLGNKLKNTVRQKPITNKPSSMQTIKDFKYINLEIEKIKANPYQPRFYFDEETIESLAISIKKDGVIQPIVVNYNSEKNDFILIAGERRLRASKKAGLISVPAIVRQLNDEEIARMSLIENIQRENLNAIDEVRGYDKLIKDFGYNQRKLSEELGIAKSTMAEYLSILKIPEDLLNQCIGKNHVSKSHLIEIAKMPEKEMPEAIKDLIENKLTINKLRKKRTEKKPSQNTIKPKEKVKQKAIIKVCSDLLSFGIEKTIIEQIFSKYSIDLSNGDKEDVQKIQNNCQQKK